MDQFKIMLENWKREVEDKKTKLITSNDSLDIKKIKYIGGVDVSFPKNKDREYIDKVHACVTLVVTEFEAADSPNFLTKSVYEHSSIEHMEVPYISGYLGFREAPWYEKELEILKRDNPELYPEVLLVDGNGIIHHEGFGSACHIGVAQDIPTIGVAKQLLHVDGLTKDDIDVSKLHNPGDCIELVGRTRGLIGKALKCTEKSTNPLYISVGHKINLKDAVDIVYRCCKYRTPGPIRKADMISREVLRKNYESHLENCSFQWRDSTEYMKELEERYEEFKHTMHQA